MEKRLVVEHTKGKLKGIYRICGRTDGDVPSHIPGPVQLSADPEDILEFASLISVKPRHIHYREVWDRAELAGRLGDYMPGGRVGDFDPKQV